MMDNSQTKNRLGKGWLVGFPINIAADVLYIDCPNVPLMAISHRGAAKNT